MCYSHIGRVAYLKRLTTNVWSFNMLTVILVLRKLNYTKCYESKISRTCVKYGQSFVIRTIVEIIDQHMKQ